MTRDGAHGVEVLLAHARGASFRRPLFGIPKGLVEAGEDLATTALRETLEETGLRVVIRAALGSVQQKSGKVVHAFWATLAPDLPADIDSKGRCQSPDGFGNRGGHARAFAFGVRLRAAEHRPVASQRIGAPA